MASDVSAIIAHIHSCPRNAGPGLENWSEDLDDIAAGAFPVAPGQEGYSDEAEWIRSAMEGHVGPALNFMRILGPEWLVDHLAQSHKDRLWWCSLHRPVEGDEETGRVTRPSMSASAYDQPEMSMALILAALYALRQQNSERAEPPTHALAARSG